MPRRIEPIPADRVSLTRSARNRRRPGGQTQLDLELQSDAILVCGVDEAGRGPLAGPVFAAAVILDPGQPISGLADSKTLSEARREQLALDIRGRARAWSVASADVDEIDTLNILNATLLAMRRAVESLSVRPDLARIDGNRAPALDHCRVETLVRGDALDPAISAASILAKTARDAWMLTLHERWPQYRFDLHKGYPTPDHLALLRRHGPCDAHRHSFAPVRAALADTGSDRAGAVR